jgi:dihydrolipoamide dehydrogenase
MADTYDLIVIGAGPGGYIAAIRAAQLGLKTAIVEREHMAGICSNWGCIPTKALLRSAEIYGHMTHAQNYGLKAGEFGFDLEAIVKRSRGIAGQMNNGVQFLMKKNKVDIIWGEATLTAPGTVEVRKTAKKPVEPQHPPPKTVLPEGTYTAKNVIIATGARPRVLPGIEPDGDRIWTYFDEARELPQIAGCHGLGRHRHGVRLLLSLARRRSDGDRAPAADPAGRGR